MSGKRIYFIACIVCYLSMGTCLHAAGTKGGSAGKVSPFSINLKVDIPITVIGALVATSTTAFDANLPRRHGANLRQGSVNALDRPVIGYGYYRWKLVGDIGTVVVPATMLSLSFMEYRAFGWRGVAEDILIVGETIAISKMVNEIVASAMPRPRPYMYRFTSRRFQARNTSWDWRSFYSGHSQTCFAASTAFSYIFMKRYPESPWVPAVWSLSLAASTLVAVSRPIAGQHFWSDVMIGAAIGTAWGIVIPALHERSTGKEKGDVAFHFAPNAAGVVLYF